MRYDFYRCSNAVIANFNMRDSQTLNILDSVFSSSLYGIELFNFNHKFMSDLYMSWRKLLDIYL